MLFSVIKEGNACSICKKDKGFHFFLMQKVLFWFRLPFKIKTITVCIFTKLKQKDDEKPPGLTISKCFFVQNNTISKIKELINFRFGAHILHTRHTLYRGTTTCFLGQNEVNSRNVWSETSSYLEHIHSYIINFISSYLLTIFYFISSISHNNYL